MYINFPTHFISTQVKQTWNLQLLFFYVILAVLISFISWQFIQIKIHFVLICINEIVFKYIIKDAVKGRIHASFGLWCEKYTNYLFWLVCEEDGIEKLLDMGNLYRIFTVELWPYLYDLTVVFFTPLSPNIKKCVFWL